MNEEKILEIMTYLETLRWKKEVISPLAYKGKVYRDAKPNTYVCKQSNRKFTVLTGTHLHNYRSSLIEWDILVTMLAHGRSEGDIANALGVSDMTRVKMYKVLYFALHFAKPSRHNVLHDVLVKKLEHRKASKDFIFKKLLEEREDKI